LDRKTAAFYNGHASLDYNVLNYTISNGFYYKLYDKLDNHLQQTFVKKISYLINCIRLLNISDKTLSKALTNGFYYKELGSKLKIH
jgi:hypothetical protein